jgi:hypothetical protein
MINRLIYLTLPNQNAPHERKKKQIEINDWYQYYRSSPVILEHDHQYYGCSVDRKNEEEKHHCLHKSHFVSFRRNQQSYKSDLIAN